MRSHLRDRPNNGNDTCRYDLRAYVHEKPVPAPTSRIGRDGPAVKSQRERLQKGQVVNSASNKCGICKQPEAAGAFSVSGTCPSANSGAKCRGLNIGGTSDVHVSGKIGRA